MRRKASPARQGTGYAGGAAGAGRQNGEWGARGGPAHGSVRDAVLECAAALALTGFLLCLAVSLTLHFRPLYYADMEILGIPEATGLPAEEIRESYDTLIDYNGMFSEGELKFPTFPMSPEGRQHFAEVRSIFVFVQWMAALLFLGALVLAAASLRGGRRRFLLDAGILSLILPVSVGVLIAANWDFAFVAFHRLFFRNDYWLFDYRTDPVILILPDAFFLHCAVLAVLLVLLGSALCFLAYALLGRRWRETAGPSA